MPSRGPRVGGQTEGAAARSDDRGRAFPRAGPALDGQVRGAFAAGRGVVAVEVHGRARRSDRDVAHRRRASVHGRGRSVGREQRNLHLTHSHSPFVHEASGSHARRALEPYSDETRQEEFSPLGTRQSAPSRRKICSELVEASDRTGLRQRAHSSPESESRHDASFPRREHAPRSPCLQRSSRRRSFGSHERGVVERRCRGRREHRELLQDTSVASRSSNRRPDSHDSGARWSAAGRAGVRVQNAGSRPDCAGSSKS